MGQKQNHPERLLRRSGWYSGGRIRTSDLRVMSTDGRRLEMPLSGVPFGWWRPRKPLTDKGQQTERKAKGNRDKGETTLHPISLHCIRAEYLREPVFAGGRVDSQPVAVDGADGVARLPLPALSLSSASEKEVWPMSDLDKAILKALKASPAAPEGVTDFAASPSATKKAKHVLDVAREKGFDTATTAVVSLGGADGTEIEHILRMSTLCKGALIEYDDGLADRAKQKARQLQTHGKDLLVLTGDVSQKLPKVLAKIAEWKSEGAVSRLLVTIHALLHELPTRGAKRSDLEQLLAMFLPAELPILLIVREPCAPRDLPPTVYLHADCKPANLAALAKAIQHRHPAVFGDEPPVQMQGKVRLPARLAVETVIKIFYLDAFHYELAEVVTSYTRDELLDVFRNVFGTEHVKHTDLQSDSFDKLWNKHKFRLTDSAHTELARPQLHISLIAQWSPPSPSRGGHEGMSRSNRPAGKSDASPNSEPPLAVGLPRGHAGQKGLVDLPDLFTPGTTSAQLRRILSRVLAKDQVDKVILISQDGLVAVESGAFAHQTELGARLVEVAGDLPEVHASGLYFAAEGYRLLADLEASPARQRQYRATAAMYYEDAIRLAPNAPAAYRGLGRIRELDGQYDDAMRLFDAAYGFALAGYAAGYTIHKAPAFAHEILRTTRHRIHCILGMKSTDHQSRWRLEVGRAELAGDVARTDEDHQRYMNLFRSRPRWFYIESFMSLVFLAKAWAEVGNYQKAEIYFLESLHAKRRMIEKPQTISVVDRANLNWWATTVRATVGLTNPFQTKVDALTEALGPSSYAGDILRAVDELIEPIVATRKLGPT